MQKKLINKERNGLAHFHNWIFLILNLDFYKLVHLYDKVITRYPVRLDYL